MKTKWRFWFTTWFVADKIKAQVPQNHYLRTVTMPDTWDKAPVGIFWTWGGWSDLSYVDYLTTQNMDEVGSENLFEKWRAESDLYVTLGYVAKGVCFSCHFKS